MVRIICCLALCCLLCGCFWQRERSPSSQCAEIVREAFPEGGVTIAQRTSEGEMTAATAQVHGRFKDRDFIAECRFARSIFSGFRWIKGPL
jgi:hypothetical protein